LREIAGAPGWQGYFSDPASASAAHGQAVANEAAFDAALQNWLAKRRQRKS
jgi:hypothetical protein